MQLPGVRVRIMGFLTENRTTVSVVIACLLFFFCMDIVMYTRIQKLPPIRPQNRTTDTMNIPISPFENLSIKEMMIDHVNQYIHYPLAIFFFKMTNFHVTFHFISANFISLCGTLSALPAAKCVSSEDLNLHRWAVLFWMQIRSFMDALDGIVARYKIGMIKNVSVMSFGYYVDGVADLAAYAILFLGCRNYLNKQLGKHRPYHTLSPTSDNPEKDVISAVTCCTTPKIFFTIWRFAIQLYIAGTLWDHYIFSFRQVLEIPQATEKLAIAQNDLLKSSGTILVIWIWKFFNAHALMVYFLVAIYFHKFWDFLHYIQYIGYVLLFVIYIISEIQLKHIRNFMASL